MTAALLDARGPRDPRHAGRRRRPRPDRRRHRAMAAFMRGAGRRPAPARQDPQEHRGRAAPGGRRRGRADRRHDRRGRGLRGRRASSDLFIAYPLLAAGPKAERLPAAGRAMPRCRSAWIRRRALDALAAAVTACLGPGGPHRDRQRRRAGPASDPELAGEVGADRRRPRARRSSGCSPTRGHGYNGAGRRARRPTTRSRGWRRPPRRSVPEGIEPVVLSAGSTPTAGSLSARGVVTEERPGTYVFGDRQQVALAGERRAEDAVAAGRRRDGGQPRTRRQRVRHRCRGQDPGQGRRAVSSPGHGGVARVPGGGPPCAGSTTTTGSVEVPAGCGHGPRSAADRQGRAEPRLPGGQPRRRARSWRRADASSTAGRSTRAAVNTASGGLTRSHEVVPTPAASRTAATRATGTAPRAGCSRPLAGAVDDGRGRPAVRRTAVEDQVDAVPELVEDLRRVARLGQAGDVGRGRRQRADGRARAPGARRGPARAARSSESRRSARRATARPDAAGRRRSARPASTRRRGPWRPAPSPRSRAPGPPSSSSSMIPLSGGRRLTSNSRSMPPGGVERDRDAVDRIGRQGDDAAAAQDVDRLGATRRVVGDGARAHASTATSTCSETAPARPRGPGRRCLLGQPRRRQPRLVGRRQHQRLDHPRHTLLERAAARCSGRPPGLRPARSASPPRDRPRRASRCRSTGRRWRASHRAGLAAGAPASGRPGPSRRRAPRTRGTADG